MHLAVFGDRPDDIVADVLDRDTPLAAGLVLGGIESPYLLVALGPGLGPARCRLRQVSPSPASAMQPSVGRSPSGNREDQHNHDRHDDGGTPPALGRPAVGGARVDRTCLVRRRRPCREVGSLGRLLHDRLAGKAAHPRRILPTHPALNAVGSRDGLSGLRSVGRLRPTSTVREGPRGVARPLGSIRHVGEYFTQGPHRLGL